MKIKDIARSLPDEIWSVFEPILPPTVWTGNGRKPYSNHSCLRGMLYVSVSGIPWEMMPAGFPSHKTCQRRFDKWAQSECFLAAWRRLAEDYELQRGINWDRLCIDGSRHPSKKGAKRHGRVR